jgi:hypothetical protein
MSDWLIYEGSPYVQTTMLVIIWILGLVAGYLIGRYSWATRS